MHSEDALRHWISLQGMPGYDPVSQGEKGPHSRTGKPRNQRPSDPSEMELHDLAADNPSQKMTKLFPGASLAAKSVSVTMPQSLPGWSTTRMQPMRRSSMIWATSARLVSGRTVTTAC